LKFSRFVDFSRVLLIFLAFYDSFFMILDILFQYSVLFYEEKEAARSSGDHVVIDDDLLYPEEKEEAQL